MKDTIEKDKRRNDAIQKYNDYHEAWNLSLKYSSKIMKNITIVTILIYLLL